MENTMDKELDRLVAEYHKTAMEIKKQCRKMKWQIRKTKIKQILSEIYLYYKF